MHEKLKRFFAENWATAGEGSSETSTSCEKLYNLGHHLDHKPSSFREQTDLGHNLEHKKLHAKRPIRSTIWSTKSCTRNGPSRARFGAQKVARETTLSGARFGAQKVARETALSGARFGAQKVARETTLSGARFGAQKVARETTHPEHDLEHKKLHAKRHMRSAKIGLVGRLFLRG